MFENVLMSRGDYLDARRQWREEYKRLSADINALKKAAHEAYLNHSPFADRLQSMRARMSNYAADMMDDLETLKETSRFTVAFQSFCEDYYMMGGEY